MRKVLFPFRSAVGNLLWWCTGLPLVIGACWFCVLLAYWCVALPLMLVMGFKRIF